MSGLFKNTGFAGSAAAEGIRLAVAGPGDTLERGPLPHSARSVGSVVEFPKRPDLNVLSETIPLFYIARNKYGFWIVRGAEGGRGGVFLSRRFAVRFARQQSAPVGCAMMFLSDALELDVENEGSRLVEPITALIETVTRRAPKLATFIALATA